MKKGFFDELNPKTGEAGRSWMRLVTFIYFLLIAIPGSYIILLKTIPMFLDSEFSWEQMIYGIVMFLVLHLGWIAPKSYQKLIDDSTIKKLLDSKKDSGK